MSIWGTLTLISSWYLRNMCLLLMVMMIMALESCYDYTFSWYHKWMWNFYPFHCWDQHKRMTTKKPFFIGSYHRIFDYISKPHTMNFVKRIKKLWKYERSWQKGYGKDPYSIRPENTLFYNEVISSNNHFRVKRTKNIVSMSDFLFFIHFIVVLMKL